MPEGGALVGVAIFAVFIIAILCCCLKNLICPKNGDKNADLENDIHLDDETKKSIKSIRKSVDEKAAQTIKQEAELFRRLDEKSFRIGSKCDSGFYSSFRIAKTGTILSSSFKAKTGTLLSTTSSSNSMASTVNGATFGANFGASSRRLPYRSLRSSGTESSGGSSGGSMNYEDELKSVRECIRNTIHHIRRDPSLLHSIDENKD